MLKTLKNHITDICEDERGESPHVELINETEESEDEPQQQPCSPGYLTNVASGTTLELLGQDLWKKFYQLGTEMIITKAGR